MRLLIPPECVESTAKLVVRPVLLWQSALALIYWEDCQSLHESFLTFNTKEQRIQKYAHHSPLSIGTLVGQIQRNGKHVYILECVGKAAAPLL